MKWTSCTILIALALGGLAACHRHDHVHDDAGATAVERPTVAVTSFTEQTELFMEYPVFMAGETGRTAIHVTRLSDFSPLSEGEVVVTLRSDAGVGYEFRDGASRPGIFGVDLAMKEPGTYEMSLRVEAPDLDDRHELGWVIVHPAGEYPAIAEEEVDTISFLKEQQWTLDFATTPAEVRPMRPSFDVPAVVRPRIGGEAILAAPVPGRIAQTSDVPVPGAPVRKGEILARIVPRSDGLRDAAALRAALVEAEQEQRLAVAERDRVERLVEARALPARRLDESHAELAASEARLAAARERWNRFNALSATGEPAAGGGALIVRAPFDGVVAEAGFAPGASIEENEMLVRVVDPDRVHVVGEVPESRASELAAVEGGELIAGDRPPVALSRPVSVGRVVDPHSRTTEVRFAFDNREARLQVGRSVVLRLLLGEESPGTVVPESALVDDAGRSIVFVQTGGESFERRVVRIGNRSEGYVHLSDGVEPGERVVSRGAYLVRLASMTTQTPSHGHVH
ncbi:MAG: efflux RND transporter periplasmic adaptor subunit [bacterium]|nr:efflux RND transporter periplasmic adaptor subunit [bacterium]